VVVRQSVAFGMLDGPGKADVWALLDRRSSGGGTETAAPFSELHFVGVALASGGMYTPARERGRQASRSAFIQPGPVDAQAYASVAVRCLCGRIVAADRPTLHGEGGLSRCKEIRMSLIARVWSVTALATVLLVPAAYAQSAALQAAERLFEEQQYVAAQEALLAIDRESLTDAERARLDELLALVPEAIKAAERAAQDQEAADHAFEEGQWEVAEKLYRALAANQYATPGARQRAVERGEQIAEKRRLAEAAKPSAPVEGSVVTEPPATAAPADQAPATAGAPEAPRRLTPTDELRMRDALLWQRAVAIAEALSGEARTLAANNDFVEARKKVAAALQAIEAAANYAEPVSRYQVAKEAVLQLRAEIERAAEEYAQATARAQREEIARRIAERRRQIEQQKAEKILQLFNSVEQLRRERRFAEAAEVLREILRIDPGNAEARYQLDWAEDLASFSNQAASKHDMNVQMRQALVNAEEALIPWDVDVMYPRNWLELTARRGQSGLSTGRDLEDVELNKQLNLTLPDVRFEETPFEQVMEFLADMTKVNLSVDWVDLTDAGIERDAPVTIRLSNVSFRTILKEVLAQVGGETQLAYAIGDGLLRVATKEKLDRDKIVLIYDIRDLLINVMQAARQSTFDVTQGMGQGGAGGGGGGGGGMFGQGNQQQGQQQGEEFGQQGTEEMVEQILDIIRQTVEPDSWRETGGGDASIRELNGQLIIYNTSDAHRQVADLLTQLRQTRALQISVETRFLNVTSNFLEEFGVDLDFVFNSGSAGYDQAQSPQGGAVVDPATGAIVLIPRDYSRIGTTPVSPGFGNPLSPGAVPLQPYNQPGFVPPSGGIVPHVSEMTPISAQQGSMSLVAPRNTGVPGSFASQSGLTPALNIAGSFLDNLQVDFLIRATQANARSSIVQAPRLVLFNSQASTISVGRSRSYVASLEPRLAEGAVGFQPVQNQADSGVSMWVQGVISADRRYVTMNLSVQQRDEPTFEKFEVQRASGNSPGAFIMLPDQSFAVLQTTVSIPDGGTVLLGGLKQVGEIEVEAGVPILSKIPVLKRAFTNQSMVKDTRTLLILVKSKIIIQQEAEEEAFPTFTGGA